MNNENSPYQKEHRDTIIDVVLISEEKKNLDYTPIANFLDLLKEKSYTDKLEINLEKEVKEDDIKRVFNYKNLYNPVENKVNYSIILGISKIILHYKEKLKDKDLIAIAGSFIEEAEKKQVLKKAKGMLGQLPDILDQVSIINFSKLNSVDILTYQGNRTIKLDEIFIERKKILSKFKKQCEKLTHPIYAFIGDAGSGKSSILWHIYDKQKFYFPLKKVYLINASNLKDTEVFKAAVEKSTVSVLLLDTVDILVYKTEDLSLLMSFMRKCREQKGVVIMTSRIKEYNTLIEVSSISIFPPFNIEKYNDEELEDALVKYTKAYVQQTTISRDFQNIKEMAFKGSSIYAICQYPLLLKMLFSLYHPNSINLEEVNIKTLYVLYWHNKIKSDFRDEMNTSQFDCSEVCSIIGFMMYSFNTLELDKSELIKFLIDRNIKTSQLDTLIKRGVIIEVESKITFFHQTFYAFSCAKYFCSTQRAFNFLDDDVNNQKERLDLMTIFEFALIMSINSSEVYDTIHPSFQELFKAPFKNMEYGISIYMYIHSIFKIKYFEVIQNCKYQNKTNIFLEKIHISTITDVEIVLQNILELKDNIKADSMNKILAYLLTYVEFKKNVIKRFYDDFGVINFMSDKSPNEYANDHEKLVELISKFYKYE